MAITYDVVETSNKTNQVNSWFLIERGKLEKYCRSTVENPPTQPTYIVKAWGPFLESPEIVSGPKSHL